MNLARLQVDIHDRILALRSIENTVSKLFFERLWEASTEEQKKEARDIILRGDKDALARWMDSHPDVDLGEMSYNKLKKLGRRLKVTNYCRLNRHDLEDAIREKQCKLESN